MSNPNNTITAKGKRVFIYEDNTAIFGYENIQIWIPKLQAWIQASQDPEKFIITSDDPETIASEWYNRWEQYIQKRFKIPFVKIESLE